MKTSTIVALPVVLQAGDKISSFQREPAGIMQKEKCLVCKGTGQSSDLVWNPVKERFESKCNSCLGRGFLQIRRLTDKQ